MNNQSKLAEARSNDFSLERCIQYVHNKRVHTTEYLENIRDTATRVAAESEIKILTAIESNLSAMSTMVECVKDRLLELPTNHPQEEEEVHHG